MPTYRFDKKGKPIASTGEIKSTASHLVQTPAKFGTDTGERAALQRATSERLSALNGGNLNRPLGQKAPDADLKKPMRNIGVAFGAVVVIIIVGSVLTTFSTMLKPIHKPAAQTFTTPVVNYAKLKPWSKVEARKHLLEAAKKAEAVGNHQAAAAILASLSDESQGKNQQSLTKLGDIYHFQLRQYSQAERAYRQALTMAQSDKKTSPAVLALSYDKLARATAAQGKVAEALVLNQEAINSDPAILEIAINRSYLLYQNNQFNEAKALNLKNQANAIKAHTVATVYEARMQDLSGRLAARSGQDKEALADLSAALRIFEKSSLKPGEYIDTMRELGWLQLRNGNRQQAALLFERVIASSQPGENKAERYVLRQMTLPVVRN